MRRLPPFDALVAFEAVARHRSVTRAAQELCITQSAVSHRIRRLEAFFGTALVRRGGAKLELTETGAAVLPQVAAALDHLAGLARGDERRLRVVAGTALCTWWLASRLSRFMAQRPGLSIELASVDTIESPIPQADVRVLWVKAGDDPGRPRQASLFVEAVFPVCSPTLLPAGRPLADRRRLLDLPLLHKSAAERGEWSWPLWLGRLGLAAGTRKAPTLGFADMGLVMSAAVDGAGVALTRSLLAHDALADGRLVAALAHAPAMESTKHHVARWPSSRHGDAAVRDFVEWLVEEARASLASTHRLAQLGGPDIGHRGRPAERLDAP